MAINPGKLSQAIDQVMSDERDVRAATAPHQSEFPYGREDEAQVTRREFCGFLALTSSALFVATGGFAAKSVLDARSAEPLPPMPIEGADSLKPGEAMNFYYPGEHDTAILVRTADGEYQAFGQKCTHLACPVFYVKEHERLECPCHEGGFDAKTGAVLYGPPPRPLDRVEIEVSDGKVIAVGRSGGGHAG